MTIREYLDKTCIKHSAFARKLGLERSTFSRYVNGSRKIPDDILSKVIKLSNGKITKQ